ncbi:DUF5133 domain-containing protein [Streptomyces sp. NPDC014894]|uniref:DUF5133 domain-containing protein n=1 Tax=unclassified Streptomyces TaxID=2593676 RepID=UPI0036F9836B
MPNTSRAALGHLLATYEALRGEAAAPVVALHVRRRLQDTARALCASTGARDIDDALAAARRESADRTSPY